jgi:Ca2+-binding EF-hand superfamily protein
MQKRTLGILAGVLIAAGGAAAVAEVGHRGGRYGGGMMSHEMFGHMGLGGGFGRGRHVGRWLQRVDANKDGTVTLDEMLAAREPRFARLDANKDGAIDSKEIEARARERSEYWVKHLIRRFDQNRDGKVAKDELERVARDRFAMRDLDGDGRITREDLPPGVRHRESRFRHWMGGRGWHDDSDGPWTLNRILGRLDRVFHRHDRNNDGAIDASDFEAGIAERVAYSSKRFLHRFDQNRDGKVTTDEFNRFAKERFAFFDLNDDGKITAEEMPPDVRGQGIPR